MSSSFWVVGFIMTSKVVDSPGCKSVGLRVKICHWFGRPVIVACSPFIVVFWLFVIVTVYFWFCGMQLFISLIEWVVVLPLCIIWILSSSSFTFFNVNAN